MIFDRAVLTKPPKYVGITDDFIENSFGHHAKNSIAGLYRCSIILLCGRPKHLAIGPRHTVLTRKRAYPRHIIPVQIIVANRRHFINLPILNYYLYTYTSTEREHRVNERDRFEDFSHIII